MRLHHSILAAGALGAQMVFASTTAMAQSNEEVVLRTDYRFNGYIAPFALALERGYYADAGIDVSIEQGQGSSTTIQTVATGTDDFGVADSATAILGITQQDLPVKILSVYTQTATMGLIYHPGTEFSGDPEDLEGATIISSAGSADLRLLEPALSSADLSTDDVDLQLVDFNARVPLFLRTEGAYLTGFATGDLLRVRAHLPDAEYVPYADFGVVAYGTGLVTSDEMLEENPEVVADFVQASRRGWEDALENPQAAVDAAMALYPDLDPQMLRDGLDIALETQLHTPATEGQPIGWTAEDDWVDMLGVLETYADLNPQPAETYYTNEFLEE